VVAVFGKGDYRLQPIYVDDLAGLAVEQGKNSNNIIIDAIEPETFTYRALIEKIGENKFLFYILAINNKKKRS